MTKETLKKLYDSKYFWIALSVLTSIMLWVYITTTEESVQQNTYSNIPVVFSGEASMRENRGLIISEVDTTSVRVKITGNRRILGKFNASDLQAVIDVSTVTSANKNSWNYQIVFPSGVDSSGFSIEYFPEIINFTVEKEASKQVEVRGTFNGNAADGYIANSDTMTFDPAVITVFGTESELEKIDHVAVVISGENVKSTFTENLPYTFMDESGNELKLSHVTAGTETIATTLTVNTIKEVALALDIIPGGGATEANCTIDIDPKKLTLSGSADELESMEKLIIGSIDLSDYAEDVEFTLPLQLSEGVQCLTGETEVKVSVKFNNLATKEFETSDLRYNNLKDGCYATLITKKLKVVIRAPEKTLEKISAKDIRVVADLADYTSSSGTVKVPAKIYIDGVTGAGAVGDYTLTINLTGS